MKKNKRGILLIIMLFVVMATFAISCVTTEFVKAKSYQIFKISVDLMVLCLLWLYLRIVYKKGNCKKTLINNALYIILGIVACSTLEMIIRLFGEYYIYAVNMDNAAKNVFAYVFAEMPKVYTNNVVLPIKIIINEIVLSLFVIFNATLYILNVMKDIVNVTSKNNIENDEDENTNISNDVYIEKGYLIFSDKYCFADGKKVLATVPYKNRLILFSEELIKGFSERIKLADSNESAAAFVEAARNSVNIEIFNNMLSLENLIHKDLNLSASNFRLELFGDYYTIDFLE